jgi:hypothetical protein
MRMAIISLIGLGIFGGCMTCPHRQAYDSLGTGSCLETTGSQRNGVTAILIGPEIDLGWGKLATQIQNAGYANVLRGSTLQMPWLADQAKIRFQNDPAARFVLIGYDLGTVAVRELYSDLNTAGLPVDHVVYLDPWTTVARRPLPPTVAVTVVRSHGWRQGLFPEAQDRIVAGIGHFDLPTHEETVVTITGCLSHTARQIVREVAVPAKFDPTQPIVPADRPAHLGSEWDFLLGPSRQPSVPKLIPERTAGLTP